MDHETLIQEIIQKRGIIKLIHVTRKKNLKTYNYFRQYRCYKKRNIKFYNLMTIKPNFVMLC